MGVVTCFSAAYCLASSAHLCSVFWSRALSPWLWYLEAVSEDSVVAKLLPSSETCLNSIVFSSRALRDAWFSLLSASFSILSDSDSISALWLSFMLRARVR